MIISIRLSIFFVKELTSRQAITFETTFSVKKTSFIVISRIVIMNEYRSSYIDIKNAIAFVFLKMKKIYNTRHQFIFFKIKNLINLRFHKGYRVFVITSKKIRSQLIRSFKILERIEHLIYRLKLSINMKIHNVISIAHLKSVIDFAENSYRRRRLSISVIVIDGEKEYEIEKLLRKRIVKREREWFI